MSAFKVHSIPATIVREPFLKRFLDVALQVAPATKKDLCPHASGPNILFPSLPPVIQRRQVPFPPWKKGKLIVDKLLTDKPPEFFVKVFA